MVLHGCRPAYGSEPRFLHHARYVEHHGRSGRGASHGSGVEERGGAGGRVVGAAVAPARERRDRRQLQRCYAERAQRIELGEERTERALRSVDADVALVDHQRIEIEAGPAAVGPAENAGVYDLRRAVDALRLAARVRVWIAPFFVEAIAVERARRSVCDAAPDAALRSRFIVGFPGETEDDVDDLAAFLGDVRLDWAGFFPYSPEEGTPAATMSDQLPEEVKAERLRYLQALQDDITTEATIAQVGRTLTVVVDQVEAGQPVARSYREAPEIDGVVLLDRGEPGEWLTVEITGGYGTDVNAIVVGPA